MPDYLKAMDYALQGLTAMIWAERRLLTTVEERLSSLTRVVEHNYRQAESVQLNAEDPEDVAMGAGMHWANYFGEDKARHVTDREKERLVNEIAAHQFSVTALAGALLQHAKHGISLVHQGLDKCPDGRLVGSHNLALKRVVWEGRNQADHWEEGVAEGKFKRSAIHGCFETLAKDDVRFADFLNRNMAFDVVELLGWKDFTSIEKDMMLMA